MAERLPQGRASIRLAQNMLIKEYLTSFKGKLTALVVTAILLPMIVSSLLLGGMLERRLRVSFESRLEAGLKTFSLILNNKEKELMQGVSRIASDNTLQITLELGIIPQLRKYLETQIEVLRFSTLIVADAQKQVVASQGKVFSKFINDEGSKLVTKGTDAFIAHSKPIYKGNDLLGYVLGAVSLKEGSFLDYLHEKLVDNYAIWVDSELIATDLRPNVLPTDWKFQEMGETKDAWTGKHDYKIMLKTIDLGERRLSYGVLLPLEEQRRKSWTMVGLIGAVVISLFALIMLLLRRFMRELIAPVTQLTEAASNIEKGKEIHYLDDKRTDEFGQMAVAFKRMVENLKRSEQELKDHRDNLQELVKERTAELEASQQEATELSEFLKKMFGRYLSSEVMNSLLENPSSLELGGERRNVTIMMSDLRGFTALSERLEPEQVVKMLNGYFEVMVEVIHQHNGTINEIIGDSLLVIFGAPQEMPDRTQQAIACAIAMQNAMAKVNEENRNEGLPELETGIGLHDTEVIVGNIGSSKRIKYSVVGSGVNMASRIESYTVGGQILISESVRNEAGGILRIDGQREVLPKGAEEPLRIYEIGGIAGRYNIALEGKESDLVTLRQKVPLRFTILEGKHIDKKGLEGLVVRLSKKGAEIAFDKPVELLANLKMNLGDVYEELAVKDFYGKVMERLGENGHSYFIRFTSVPPEVVSYFQAHQQHAVEPSAS
jgi:class 3 adenylate cyclase/HAMP domain-containing protein